MIPLRWRGGDRDVRDRRSSPSPAASRQGRSPVPLATVLPDHAV